MEREEWTTTVATAKCWIRRLGRWPGSRQLHISIIIVHESEEPQARKTNRDNLKFVVRSGGMDRPDLALNYQLLRLSIKIPDNNLANEKCCCQGSRCE